MSMIVGMDFGTTNSGLAVFDDRVKLIPIDSRNPSAPHVVRTTLYISRHYEHYIGRKAIDEYYERNQGRPIKLRKQHVGTIELNYASLGTFYRDVFVWVDELEPGRLFRSMKTYLADEDFLGTSVWGRFYTMEDLVSVFLFLSKIQAEKELGKELTEIGSRYASRRKTGSCSYLGRLRESTFRARTSCGSIPLSAESD
jgi:hypothetical chaperone protein